MLLLLGFGVDNADGTTFGRRRLLNALSRTGKLTTRLSKPRAGAGTRDTAR